nr:hypothetical protein [Evansella caseinilytica]
MQTEKNWLKRGVAVGVIAGSIFIIANKKTRAKITSSVGECREKTKQFVKIVNENREPFIKQLKTSGDKFSAVIDSASEDIRTLVDSSRHLKEHTQVLVKTLADTKSEFQLLSKKLTTENTMNEVKEESTSDLQ